MSVRKATAMGGLLLFAFVMSACFHSPAEITDDQIEQWRAQGHEMVSAATSMDFVPDSAVNMAGGTSNMMWIEIHFATFADLKDSAQAVGDFEAVIEAESEVTVETQLVNMGAQKFEDDVALRLADGVPGLEGAYVESAVWPHAHDEVPALEATAYVYVTSEDVVDPTWLDLVADITQEAVTEGGGGSITSIVVLPAHVWELGPEGAHIERSRHWVWDLPGIKDAAAGSDCVRTDSWAYDIKQPWAAVFPASEPGGACASAGADD